LRPEVGSNRRLEQIERIIDRLIKPLAALR
jgi:hypothetical protein